jgi:hypothetical protein
MVDLTFQKVDSRGQAIDAPMTVKYAPAELTLAKGAQYAEVAIPGLELPVLQFVRGEATTLSMGRGDDTVDGFVFRLDRGRHRRRRTADNGRGREVP